MSAMVLGSEAFRAGFVCGLSMKDRRRSSLRATLEQALTRIEKGMLREFEECHGARKFVAWTERGLSRLARGEAHESWDGPIGRRRAVRAEGPCPRDSGGHVDKGVGRDARRQQGRNRKYPG
jgi:hypothetical protein